MTHYHRACIQAVVRITALGVPGNGKADIERVVDEVMANPEAWLTSTPRSTRRFDIERVESGERVVGVTVETFDGDHRSQGVVEYDEQLNARKAKTLPALSLEGLARAAEADYPNESLAGIGVAGALKAMLPFWRVHFQERRDTAFVKEDLDEAIRMLKDIRDQF